MATLTVYTEVMTHKRREHQIDRLEMACALAALGTVSAGLVWAVNANLSMVLTMLVAADAVLRDLQVLWLPKETRSEGPNTSEASIPVHQRTPGKTDPRTMSVLRE